MSTPAANSTPPIWHTLSPAAALARLGSRESGLTPDEVTARRATHGRNILPEAPLPSIWLVFARQFRSPLIYLLVAAALVSAAIGEMTDAGFIAGVLIFNAVIGAFQERRAETSAQALRKIVPQTAMVRRGGGRERIDSTDLVPGDVVRLESGDRVPADLRLLSAMGVLADESLLTGESQPVGKAPEAELAEAAGLGDRHNMLHAGTTILSGRAAAVVVETGARTALGAIAAALARRGGAEPPLVQRLRHMTQIIAITMTVAIAVLALAQLMRGAAAGEVFLLAVALAVSAVPEGLPVAITVALAVATVRMARRNVIVRVLPAVEGLGACTMIASDKTGTLTRNELTVKKLWLPELGELEVEGEGYQPDGAVRQDGRALTAEAEARARALAATCMLCNEASLHRQNSDWVHFGDTVDVALLVLGHKLGLAREEMLQAMPEVGALPFEPERRFAASFNEENGETIAHIKGAAETVLPRCNGTDRAAALARVEEMARAGIRVLAVARGPVRDGPVRDGPVRDGPVQDGKRDEAALEDLEFLGLVGLMDPVRREVPEAVRQCRQAGVAVSMITGDHPATALAIARDVGIAEREDQVLHGADLAQLSGAAADAAITRATVFARVEPAQKTQIVQSFQRAGHFVAVTGDGANDAPALGAANIGLAMGKGGTDVARGAADLILTDDNFASIVNGIEEGRVAYANVRKVTNLLIASGLGEIVLFLLCFAAGLPPPLFAVQLLWLNVVTNGIQHVALAFERAEPGVLRAKPRPPRQGIFDRRMVEQVALAGMFIGIGAFLYYRWCLAAGWRVEDARNAVLLLMVLFENALVFHCRSETRSALRVPFWANPFVALAALAALGVHVAAMYLPGLRGVLDVAPVTAGTWLTVAIVALGLMAVLEGYKGVRAYRTIAP